MAKKNYKTLGTSILNSQLSPLSLHIIMHIYKHVCICFRGIQEMAENYIEENLNKLENSVDIDMNNEISDSIEKHSDDFRVISEHKHKEVHESKIKNTGEDISRSLEELR